MTASSFLPAATQMIYDMRLQHLLRGVSFECPAPALREQPILVHCELEGQQLSSQAIDLFFHEAKAAGRSIYTVDEPLLRSIAPDIIFTQETCEICLIDAASTAKVIHHMNPRPEVVALSPHTLEDVFSMAITIAGALGEPETGKAYVAGLRKRIQQVQEVLQKATLPTRKVSLVEWIHPLYQCGHWIPDQVRLAGGLDALGVPGGDSRAMSWTTLLDYDPEVIVFAPCGYTVHRTMQDLPALEKQPGWRSLRAVRDNRVYIADFDLFTQPSASTLVDGIELLAACFHPGYFSIPCHLKQKTAVCKSL